MGQSWLSCNPEENRAALQISLFGDIADDDCGNKSAPAFSADKLSGRSYDSDSDPLSSTQEEGGSAVQMGLFDVNDNSAYKTSKRSNSIRRANDSDSKSQDFGGPELDLNDETLVYFRNIGVRSLVAEMVIQTVRDRVYVQDEARMAKLRVRDPQGYEEVLCSADWLSTNEGRLAIQMLYPDWDHVTIIRRIHEDPKGVLTRMTHAGMSRSQEIADGFDEMPLSGESASAFAGRMDIFDDVDMDAEEFSFR